MTAAEEVAGRVLEFWFGPPGAPEDARRQAWFRVDPDFDRQVREGFLADWEDATAGRLDALMATADGALALVLLLDQFPRNMFRGTARAFASDAKARDAADQAVRRRLDGQVPPARRLFFYLPFEHSEDLTDQDRGLALIAALGDGEATLYAQRHREIVARFGRFPHRNAALGRATTAAEAQFLTEPNSSF